MDGNSLPATADTPILDASTPILDTPILNGTNAARSTATTPLHGILITTAEEDATMLDSSPATTPSHGVLITTADDDAETGSNEDIRSLLSTQSLSNGRQSSGTGSNYSADLALIANPMVSFTNQSSSMTDQDGTSKSNDNKDNEEISDAHVSTNLNLMLNSMATPTDEISAVAGQDGTNRVNGQNIRNGAFSFELTRMVDTLATPSDETTVVDGQHGIARSSNPGPRSCRFTAPYRRRGRNCLRDDNVQNPFLGESSSMATAAPFSRGTRNGMANSTSTSTSRVMRTAGHGRWSISRIPDEELFDGFGTTGQGTQTGYDHGDFQNKLPVRRVISRHSAWGMTNSTITSAPASQAIPTDGTSRVSTAPERARMTRALSTYLRGANNVRERSPPLGDLISMSPRQPSSPDSNGMIKCICCQEDIHFVHCMYADCNGTRHAWCQECLERKFISSCANGSEFPARCCRGRDSSFNLDDAAFLLSADTLQKYTQKLYESRMGSVTHCADAACNAFIRPHNIRGVVATCQACMKQTCTLCKHKMHEPGSEEANGNCVGNPGEDGLIAAAQDNGWHKCEGCQVFVERTSGCNHMVYA